MKDDVQSLSHSKWRCKYHIVFAPKYRRQIVYGKIKADVGRILRELSERKGVEILEAECCPDHIHMRLSMIGSASTELTAATVGAQAYGAVLGGEGYNLNAMATSWFTMAINGCGWLVVTLLFTHRIGQVKDKIGGTKTAAFAIVTAACNLGLCANMLAPYVIKLNAQTVSVVVGAASAFVLMQIAKKTKWLKPYVLGFSMIVGIVVGYFFM